MYTLFVTGGIASGKSKVTRELVSRGACHIDLDDVAHQILDDPQVKADLFDAFGSDIFDACEPDALMANLYSSDTSRDMLAGTSVNKKRLASRAFENHETSKTLNAITHPRILERLGQTLTGYGCSCMYPAPKLVVVEIPLIEHAGESIHLADEILTVRCPIDVRRLRAEGRGMHPLDFDARAAAQIDDSQRESIADTVIDNSGSTEDLTRALDTWWDARESSSWKPVRQGRR